MRHSSIDLTMNVYTDPRLLDVRKALDALPDLPLDEGHSEAIQKATGTDGADVDPGALAPLLALACDRSGKSPSRDGKRAEANRTDRSGRDAPQVVEVSKEGRPLPSNDKGRHNSERLDLNQRPLRPEREGNDQEGAAGSRVVDSQQTACDGACTGPGQIAQEDALRAIAEMIQDMPTEARRQLAQMLATTDEN